MDNRRRKKSVSETVVILGTVSLFLGLVVMLIGIIVAGDDEEIGSLVVLFVGMGLFIGSAATVCVASVFVNRGKKKALEKVKAALPENAVLLPDGASAHFTEEGLRILRDSAFADFAPVIPYSELTIYCRCFRSASRAKGREAIFLMLPAGLGAPPSEEMEEDCGNMFVVGEEVLPLANRYGVKIVDHRHPPVKKLTLKKKFTYRSSEQRKMAIRWTAISITAFAAVLGLCILLALYTEYGSSSGLAGGLAAGVITPCVLTAARGWKRNVLEIYEEGVLLSSNAGKSFLFWEEIIGIEENEENIFFDCGGIDASFPKLEGTIEYLREIHPEKFQEGV